MKKALQLFKKNLRKKLRVAWLLLAILVGLFVFTIQWRSLHERPPIVIFMESMQDYSRIFPLKKYLKHYHILWHATPDFMVNFNGAFPDPEQIIEVKENAVFLASSHDPSRYSSLCYLDMREEDLWQKLDTCIQNGAKGVLNYAFYLDHKDAMPPNRERFVEIMQEHGLVMVLPFQASALDQLPKLLEFYDPVPVYCPYWCASLYRTDRLSFWLERHPNLFVGLGFGNIQKSEKGYTWLQEHRESVSALLNQYPDRFLLETDLILNQEDPALFYAYYVEELRSFWLGERFESQAILPGKVVQGIDLLRKTQKKILFQNAAHLLQWD